MPALSLCDHLKNDFEITLATDDRGSKFINKNKYKFNLIDVPNLFLKLHFLPINIFKFIKSIYKSYFFLKKKKYKYFN